MGSSALLQPHSPASREARLANLPPLENCGLASPPPATSWNLPDYPPIEGMRQSMLATFRLCETRFEGAEGPVYGLMPAREYGMIYVRDLSTMMPSVLCFYGDEHLRTR